MNSIKLFEKLYGTKLILGAIIIASALFTAAYLGEARLDGVLSLHFGKEVSASAILKDILINLICLLVAFGTAIYLSTKRFPRIIDLLPQLIWAQCPLIPLALLNFIFDFKQLAKTASQNPMGSEMLNQLSSGPFWLTTILLISGMIVQVHFFYGLFKVDSGLKGTKLGWTFTAALLTSMISSIYLISVLN